MASSLLVLLDDIATVLDDVAVLTKAAAKKTAGVIGDDLAVNAEQVSGVKAARELPVVWAVFKGSLLNKCILVPAALAISTFAPWAITPLLMLGGAYLCFEGFEKTAHAFSGDGAADADHQVKLTEAFRSSKSDLLALEKDKIRGAIRTDFVLSAEIIAITLGVVAAAQLESQVVVLIGVALLVTVGIYGLVAGIVKLDDAGLYLVQRPGADTLARLQRRLGHRIVRAAPYLMRTLSVVGTIAMFLVGGGIIAHGVPRLEAAIHHLAESLVVVPILGDVLVTVAPILMHAVLGIAVGAVLLALIALVQRLRGVEAGSEGSH